MLWLEKYKYIWNFDLSKKSPKVFFLVEHINAFEKKLSELT